MVAKTFEIKKIPKSAKTPLITGFFIQTVDTYKATINYHLLFSFSLPFSLSGHNYYW